MMLFCFFYLAIIIVIPADVNTDGCQVAPAGRDVIVLDRVDNAQTVQSLIVHVDGAINAYLNDHALVRSSKARVIIWNRPPDDKVLERYFAQHFTLIKYDDTYRDFQLKDFDYTRQTMAEKSNTWEKFVFVRVKDQVITLLISYTVDAKTLPACHLQLDEFLALTLSRMFNKIFSPTKSVYNHGISLITDDNREQYFFVYHDNKEGFVERIVKSFSDGTKEQEKMDKRALSSCILMIKGSKKSIHSIRHPIRPGYVVPNFHAHYSIPFDETHLKHHDGL